MESASSISFGRIDDVVLYAFGTDPYSRWNMGCLAIDGLDSICRLAYSAFGIDVVQGPWQYERRINSADRGDVFTFDGISDWSV